MWKEKTRKENNSILNKETRHWKVRLVFEYE